MNKSSTGFDFKFDAVSGETIWEIQNGCSGGFGWTSAYSAGRLYFLDFSTTRDYKVLDAQSATILHTYPSALMPAVNTALAAFVDNQSTVTMIDLLTGNTRWTDSSLPNLTIDPLLIDGVLITADGFGTVYAHDAGTGALLWSGAAGSQINQAYWTQLRPLPGMGVGDGWLIVPADHSIRAWKLVP